MPTPRNFGELVDLFLGVVELVIPLIFILALLVIVWKLVDAWIINADNEKKIEEGRHYALWGVLVLVVMSTVWAIIRLLRSSIFGG